MQPLVDLAYRSRAEWEAHARKAFADVVAERYAHVKPLHDKKNDERRVQLRVNANPEPGAAPYAALIGPEQDPSGPYGGMSFVMFPADDGEHPAVIGMVVGTNGLAPDDAVLGRPGHARKCAAIAAWLNARQPSSAWAKRDPVRVDLELPRSQIQAMEAWKEAASKYGKVLYATYVPPRERSKHGDAIVRDAIAAFMDLFFDERNIRPKKAHQADAERLRRAWMSKILPDATDEDVATILARRRFAILEGPPGTGKTEMALRLLRDRYRGRGRVIQFHPATTYESFVGGLAPRDGGALGFTFRPVAGHLMEAALEAKRESDPYLLVIDEINRADLAKVLGEAIHLLEPDRPEREIDLAHDFPDFGRKLALPKNLHILGTMNSADRSIAILDVAVRRRFAFIPLWPQLSVVEAHAGDALRTAFVDLLTLFIEHASDDALPLVPGHAYFLGSDTDARAALATSVKPLLAEYLAQGYVAGFADEIRAYMDRLDQPVESAK